MTDLAAQVAKCLYDLALAAYDGARGRVWMEGAGKGMQLLVCPYDSDGTADALEAACHLDGNTIHASMDFLVVTEDHCPAGRTSSLAPRALKQVDITIGFFNNGVAELAVAFLMLAFIIGRLVANSLFAFGIWTRELPEAALHSRVPFYFLPFHFLFAASAMVGAFDDQVIQLGTNQPYRAGAVCP
jgi:hypothetical protein